MSYLQEKIDIEKFFADKWTQTNIVYDNGMSLEDDEWVRLSIQHSRSFQASMGDYPAFRHIGVVFLQIFTATNTGSGRAMELADIADGLFRNLVLTNLRFKVPQVKRVSHNSRINQRPEWLQVNVSTDFYRGS